MKNIIHDSLFFNNTDKDIECEVISLESISMNFEDSLIKSSAADNMYVDRWVNSERSLSKKYFLETLKDS